MIVQESAYQKLVDLSKKKAVICFGAGKIFDTSINFLDELGIREKILGIADNDINKQGQEKEAFGNTFYVMGFKELVALKDNKDFCVLVTSSFYEAIEKQFKSHPTMKDIEILNIKEVLEERTFYLTYYTNLFRNMCKGVGKDGEDMTLSILMHNRGALTVRLIESVCDKFDNYKGEILVGNNYSDTGEIELVRKRLLQSRLKWRIIDFKEHYAIPKGKNLLNREVNTEWILQLDNDTYFTNNPINKINEDISELGCHIWGLPYYDTRFERVVNYGSNLKFMKTADGIKYLECLYDMPFEQEVTEWKAMLCTYAAGCTSLFKKDFFVSIGGYDENLYMMEDIDLMYRINMMGYKIGNIGTKCLVHDHKIINTELGKKYEQIRFDNDRLQKCKDYLRMKYGFEF